MSPASLLYLGNGLVAGLDKNGDIVSARGPLSLSLRPMPPEERERAEAMALLAGDRFALIRLKVNDYVRKELAKQ